MTDQATTTLMERFEELEERIRQADDLPMAVGAARRKAAAAAASAQQDLTRFYATGVTDAKRERELVKALEDAEREMDASRWELRSEGAHQARGLAVDELRDFVGENFDAIAAELIPRSVQAYRALRVAAQAYDAAVAPYLEVRAAWSRVITAGRGHTGTTVSLDEMSADDIRIPGRVTTPMPESLKPLAREWARENPATTTEED